MVSARSTHNPRIRLPKSISHAALRLRQESIFPRHPMTFIHDGWRANCQLGFADPFKPDQSSQTKPNPDLPWMIASIDGLEVAVQLSYGQMRLLMGDPIEGLGSTDQALLLENHLAPWLDLVEQQSGLAVRLQNVQDTKPASLDHGFALDIQLTSEEDAAQNAAQTVSLRLAISLDGLEAILPYLASLRAKATDLETLCLKGRYCLFSKAYDLQTLKALQVGDGIFLPAHDDNALLYIEQSLIFPVRREGQQLVVTGPQTSPPNNKRLDMSDDDFWDQSKRSSRTVLWDEDDEDEKHEDAANSSNLTLDANDQTNAMSDLDDISVTLSIQAGEITLPIGRLRELTKGSLIEMTGMSGDVDLIVNGKKIGEGVLVSIGDGQAVEITRLGKKWTI